MLSGFTAPSRREPSEVDGRVGRPNERERVSQTPYNFRQSSLVTSRKSVEDLRRCPIGDVDFATKKDSASQEFRALRELTKPGVARWPGRSLPLRQFFPKNFGIVV